MSIKKELLVLWKTYLIETEKERVRTIYENKKLKEVMFKGDMDSFMVWLNNREFDK